MKYTIDGDKAASEKLFLLFSFYWGNRVEIKYSFISFEAARKLFGTDNYDGVDVVNELSTQLIVNGIGQMCAANREDDGVHFAFTDSFIDRMLLMGNNEK